MQDRDGYQTWVQASLIIFQKRDDEEVNMGSEALAIILGIGLIVMICMAVFFGIAEAQIKPQCERRCGDWNMQYFSLERTSGITYVCKCIDQNNMIVQYKITN
jgi:hypothetical protein